jgi:hypothetical protein
MPEMPPLGLHSRPIVTIPPYILELGEP